MDHRVPEGFQVSRTNGGPDVVTETGPCGGTYPFVQHDLAERPWPFEEGSVGFVLARHVVEHLEDPVGFFEEAWRILRADGDLSVAVPWGGSPEDHKDPTHRTSWRPESFAFFDRDGEAGYRLTDRLWDVRSVEVRRTTPDWPGAWHLKKYLGLPLGRPLEIQVIMRPCKGGPS